MLYSFSIDNNADGIASDVIFEVRFQNEIRGTVRDLTLPLSYVALPPITALDGPGSEGLGLRQSYTVSMVTRGKREVLASGLFAVPSNVGPRTMPDYASLAAQGIYDVNKGVRVFAGGREDPFYIDLGATFDTLNLRRSPLPLLTAAEDADDTQNAFGIDQLGSFNVSTIALEVPASLLTRDGKGPDETMQSKLGAYASTARRAVRVLRTQSGTAGRDALKQIGEMRLDAIAVPIPKTARALSSILVLDPGAAPRQPARERAHYQHHRQRPLERDDTARRRPLPGVLPEPAPCAGARSCLRRASCKREPHRPARSLAQVQPPGSPPRRIAAPRPERAADGLGRPEAPWPAGARRRRQPHALDRHLRARPDRSGLGADGLP
ncbi:DUF4331 family protein, partial [Candidatus Gracilibacteria bacterium]|nr:DUF4331 family protein [Candidatus Gracilibacteria bacterium]